MMKKRPVHKVLMIAYGWPPRGGVGVVRPLKFAKYLSGCGWAPTVLTPIEGPSLITCDEREGEFESVRVVKAGRVFYRPSIMRRLRALSGIGEIPDNCTGWHRDAVRAGARLLGEERFDLIYSSSPPETVHMIASSLKAAHPEVRWVADLRDPWADYHQDASTPVRDFLMQRLERRTLASADAIVTVSPSFGEHLKGVHGKNVSVLTNGFDEDDLDGVRSRGVTKERPFTIAYAGKINRKHQKTDAFFAALGGLVRNRVIEAQKLSITFHLFGHDAPDLQDIVVRNGLERSYKQGGYLPYRKYLESIASADLLVVFDWDGNDAVSRGVIPAKIFDYIGVRRPIILVSARSTSDLADIVARSGLGSVCRSEGEIARAVERLYNEYLLNGKTEARADEDVWSSFKRPVLTQRLAEIFDEVLK